jgi:poly-gamma-glutamate synthesis protein (capsule biosynthesis protein)
LDLIRESSGIVDLLIVSAHWGSNWGYSSPQEHVSFAHALIEAGADVIFGHSSHVFRGIEFYKGRPILYSAGNFIDDYAINRVERNDQSFIFVIEVADGKPRVMRLYPTLIRGCHASLAQGVHALAIAEKMKELCSNLGTHTAWNQGQQRLELEDAEVIEPAYPRA